MILPNSTHDDLLADMFNDWLQLNGLDPNKWPKAVLKQKFVSYLDDIVKTLVILPSIN